MKKLIIMSVAGLAIGTGIGTGAAYVRRPAASDPADGIAMHADSLAHATDGSNATIAADDSSSTASADAGHRPDTEPVPVTGPAGAPTASNAPPPHASHGPQGSTAPSPAARSQAVDTTEVERMALIFGTMKPQEAARVLERLEDREIEALLLGLNDRKAAAILASMPAERAASLTRSILTRAAR